MYRETDSSDTLTLTHESCLKKSVRRVVRSRRESVRENILIEEVG